MQKIIIPNYKPLSTNMLKGINKFAWNRMRDEAYQIMWAYIKKCGIKPETGLVDLEFVAYFPDRRSWFDSSNIVEKVYEDQLVKQGILKDDNPNYVRRIIKQSTLGESHEFQITLHHVED